MLYPYMGSWATGCQVTAVSGIALIIEWQRGTDVWRRTYLQPGQSHIIASISPEDGAMIEGPVARIQRIACKLQPAEHPCVTDTHANTDFDRRGRQYSW